MSNTSAEYWLAQLKGRRVKVRGGLTGPEPGLGCFNTGLAPVLRLDVYGYWVGHENAVDDAQRAFRRVSNREARPPRTQVINGRKVHCFAGRAAANKAFAKLCAEACLMRARDREEVRELRSRAAGGDLGAVLDLGLDHGLVR